MKYKTIRELFSDRSRWTKNSIAKDKNGKSVHADEGEAVSFCLLGAVYHVYGYSDRGHGWGSSSKSHEVISKINRKLVKSFPKRIYSLVRGDAINLHFFNDNDITKFEEILEVVRAARV